VSSDGGGCTTRGVGRLAIDCWHHSQCFAPTPIPVQDMVPYIPLLMPEIQKALQVSE
jgi:hypothetical protein